MNKVCSVISVLLLAGCSTYKIEKIDSAGMTTPKLEVKSIITVTQQNSYPEDFQCHEPILYFLTLGVMPIHCIRNYSVMLIKNLNKQDDIPLGAFQVTSVSGWAALFLAPFPQWKFGYSPNIEHEIKNLLLVM